MYLPWPNWILTLLVWWLTILIMVDSCLHGIPVQSLQHHWKLLPASIFHDNHYFICLWQLSSLDFDGNSIVIFGFWWQLICLWQLLSLDVLWQLHVLDEFSELVFGIWSRSCWLTCHIWTDLNLERIWLSILTRNGLVQFR